jgi:hypothetical protein
VKHFQLSKLTGDQCDSRLDAMAGHAHCALVGSSTTDPTAAQTGRTAQLYAAHSPTNMPQSVTTGCCLMQAAPWQPKSHQTHQT